MKRTRNQTEPRTAGEGALADERTIRELGFAIKDAVKEAWPAEKRDRVARAALKCIALRQPSTDRTAGEGEVPVGWLCKSPEDGLTEFEHSDIADPWREPLTRADKDAGWTAVPLFAASSKGGGHGGKEQSDG